MRNKRFRCLQQWSCYTRTRTGTKIRVPNAAVDSNKQLSSRLFHRCQPSDQHHCFPKSIQRSNHHNNLHTNPQSTKRELKIPQSHTHLASPRKTNPQASWHTPKCIPNKTLPVAITLYSHSPCIVFTPCSHDHVHSNKRAN